MAANLDVLKQKYQSVFAVAQRRGVVVKNAHIENDKLLLRASAPNDQIKNELWTAIKAVDSSYSDLVADITIDASLKAPEN
nr:peptidoglycan-binding protein [Acidobacteriota bacterium]